MTTSDQREASLEDQLRECEELCAREGFTVVARETDFGMSGESKERPGYQRVLQAIERGDAEVIVAHELSRLWRSPAEQAVQLEQFEFRGRHVVTSDFDNRRSGSEFLAAVKGAQSKSELRQLASRVHRTHKGLALAGRSTGGRTYGYKSEPILDSRRTDAYGRPLVIGATRVIDPAAAEVVRRIFTIYADGMSPRRIAAQLNHEGVPSPGAAWQRKTRRTDAKWLASAIHGDPKRNSGILNCTTYVGRVTWNLRQMKKRPGTSKRVAFKRTAADVIVREEPSLRIISDELWQRVKDRQAKQAHELGQRVIGGLRKHRPGGGRPSKYMLSGLLKCEACRAGFVLSNGTRYQCASHTNGGDDACDISLSVPRDRVERVILDFTKAELPRIIEDIERRYREPHLSVDHSPRIAELQQESERLVAAISKMGGSDALTRKLAAVESELARLKAASMSAVQPAYITSREPMARRVERMLDRLAKGGEVAQIALRELFPAGFMLCPDPNGGRYLWVHTQTASPDVAALLDADGNLPPQHWPRVYNGATGEVGNSMVAGAGFEPATFGL